MFINAGNPMETYPPICPMVINVKIAAFKVLLWPFPYIFFINMNFILKFNCFYFSFFEKNKLIIKFFFNILANNKIIK